MGSTTSTEVLLNNNEEKKERLSDHDNLATFSDVDMVADVVDLPATDCFGDLDLGDDPVQCLECLCLPFKLIIGLCLG